MIDQTQMTVQLKREGEYTAIQFLDAKDELVLYMSLGAWNDGGFSRIVFESRKRG